MVESTEAGSTASEDVPAAEAIGISKQFGSTVALRGVSVSLRSGRCLGLVGRNGAGKSTLVSIMSGIYGADRGEVRFDGGPAPALGDIDAWRQKISTVFQHSMVVPKLTVAENVFLNVQPGRSGFVDWKTMRVGAKRVLAEWGFENVDANALCSTLTVEQRQLVEIARALAAGRRCLLLDEPTSALERAEIQRLFERVRSMVANGVAVLYISHHLEEVFEVCDDVAVLRDGELVMSRPMAGLSKDALVAAMVGPDAATIASLEHPGAKDNGQRADHGKPCLVVEHLKAHSPRGAVRDVSFEVHHGERVALLGSLGAGVATAARAVAGSESWDSGSIEVDGTPLVPMRRDKALKTGVGYVPEDRRAEGFVRLLGVGENLTMTIVDRLANRIGAITPSRRTAAARPLAKRLSIVSAGLSQPLGELSGGNQQKVTVARGLASKPKLVVAMTPTRGVDVASKAVLLQALSSLAIDDGAAVLVATDDLDDLVICDRVLVLRGGEVVAEFTEPPFNREELIAAIEGLVESEA
ncbi:MAG TPA: sugar ABC transporter ATP-binding protein [Acidimicrobiales bacterium]|nr:sugar ABC transporter ATP-binding protein [Acidimicrobiales bacterium]